MSAHLLGCLLVLLSALIESVSQLSFKLATRHADKGLGDRRWISAGISCFVVNAVLWTLVLQKLEVSDAFPMDSLCFVMVVLLSFIFLHEKVAPQRWAGAALIVAGTAIVGLL